jgi:hypothetical protein
MPRWQHRPSPRCALSAPSQLPPLRHRPADLDAWVAEYNTQRPHQGRWCYGKTPMQTLIAALALAKEKLMAA